MKTIAEVLRGARCETERRDFEVLLAAALDVDRAHLYAHGDDPLGATQAAQLREMLQLHALGTPVAYITGRRAFWDLELDVTPDVLIPRPETELLVEIALPKLPPGARVLDLGTGSGAIALAIKRQRADCVVVATDASENALAIARRNASKYALDIELRVSDWYGNITETFELIVSNPPYVRTGDPHLDALVGEPRTALLAGDDGLAALRNVIAGAAAHLVPRGWLLVEHGFDQGPSVHGLMEMAGFSEIATRRDASGHERVTLGQR